MKIFGAALIPLLLLASTSVAAGDASPRAGAEASQVRVELYGTSWCGYCKMAKKFFNERKIPFVEYDIEKDQNAYVRFRQYNPQGGVPFVVIGKYGIPGYSEQGYSQALELTLDPSADKPAAKPGQGKDSTPQPQKGAPEPKPSTAR